MANFPRLHLRSSRLVSGLLALLILAFLVITITVKSGSNPDHDDVAFVGDSSTTTTAAPPSTVASDAAMANESDVANDDEVAERRDPDTSETALAPPEHLAGEPDHLRPSLSDSDSIVDIDDAASIGYPTTTTTAPPSPLSGGGGSSGGSGGPSPTTTVGGSPPPDPPPSGSTTALGLAASNTGVVGGQSSGVCSATLTSMEGAVTIDDAWLDSNNGGSRTVENFDISGNIVVTADNVTLRCGRVVGNADYSIENKATGLKLEWIEANQTSDGKTILGGNYTAYRCNVYGGEDSIHVNTGSVTITECYIHDQNYIGGDPHPDAIQATSGGSVQRLTVVRSKLISFYKAPNAALQINVANSWSITDSYLWGGVYSILGDPGNPGTVTNNYFGWDSSQSGAIGGVSTTRSGNVWWEWVSPKCSGSYSADTCSTPSDHPGNGTPI